MYTCYIQSVKILASFCSWAGWLESDLVDNSRRQAFVWCGSYNIWLSVWNIAYLKRVCLYNVFHVSRAMRKRVLCHMQTTKAQISLRIRAFVVHCLDSISSFYSRNFKTQLASVAAQAGLCLAWSETPEDTFCRVVAHVYSCMESHSFHYLSNSFLFHDLSLINTCCWRQDCEILIHDDEAGVN